MSVSTWRLKSVRSSLMICHREMLEVVAQSASERGLRNIKTQQGVAESLPFADGSFDYIFSRYSAHHWHDLDAGLREVTRVLKPRRNGRYRRQPFAGGAATGYVSAGGRGFARSIPCALLLADGMGRGAGTRRPDAGCVSSFSPAHEICGLDRADADAESAVRRDPRAATGDVRRPSRGISTSTPTAALTWTLPSFRHRHR